MQEVEKHFSDTEAVLKEMRFDFMLQEAEKRFSEIDFVFINKQTKLTELKRISYKVFLYELLT